jgi:hypothetical protein
MKEDENIYDKIKELVGVLPGNLNILEDQIDLDLQMKYFDSSRKYKKNFKNRIDPGNAEDLYKDDISNSQKKDILIKLASQDKVESYRSLQNFLTESPAELREWTIMALQESRMLLESKLLDENQVFISTGLGGKGHKLRYFVVILGERLQEFSELQKRIIKKEFEFTLQKHNSEIEDFGFSGNMATVMAVVPMQIPIKPVFEEAIFECNNFGDFIQSDFVITNVKKLSFKEIEDFLQQRGNNEIDIDSLES